MSSETLCQNVSVEKNDRSEAIITAEISADAAMQYRPRALKKLGENVELPGFRKGHVPEKLLVERLGEQALWEEIAEMAIADVYPSIITEHKLSAIGRPNISVTKLAPGNAITFKIEVALEPDVTLPDYKAIAKEVMAKPDDLAVTDKDIDAMLLNVRKNKWRIDHKDKADRGEEPKDDEVPKLTTEMVKQLGDFVDVQDFTAKLQENLKLEKKHKAKEKKRIELGEKMIEGAVVSLPRILVESELNSMLGQLKADIERMGGSFDEYLKRNSKTENDLRVAWEKDAERRAKLQLILNKIAHTEHLHPNKEVVEHEVTHLMSRIKDADERRVRLYAMTVLQNESVFAFLERKDTETLSQP